MRLAIYTSAQDHIISPSLTPFPSSSHHQNCPSPPTLPFASSRAGPHFQRLFLAPNLSRQEPNSSSRGCGRWVLKPIACIRETDPVTADSPAKALRKILESPGIHQGPACFDALSAKLVESAGFKFCFTSGFSVSAARLGLPDVGLISYGEMVDQGYQITQAVSIPVIGDGDNGYGNHINVKRTVKGFIKAGFAGIILEDQISPKACGHTQGRKVVSREEAVMRIKAAIDARNESGSDIVIIARSDSRQAVSLEESLWRARAFADAGADVLFIDALASKEEMKAFCEISPLLPKMANMLEGGGKTPILNPIELEEIGFKIVSYPLSLIGVSIRAMQDALTAIKGGRLPPPGNLPSFEEIKEILGFNAYYEEEKRYIAGSHQPSSQTGYSPTTSNLLNTSQTAFQDELKEKGENPRDPVVEVVTPYVHDDSKTDSSKDQLKERGENPQDPVVEVVTPYVYDDSKTDGSKDPFSGFRSRLLRVKITGSGGFEKLDVRIPAGFLDGFVNVIPGLGGMNLKAMLDEAVEAIGGTDNFERGKKLIDFSDRMGDRIQVFLE